MMTTTTKTNKKEIAKKNPKFEAFLKAQEAKEKAEAERIANLKGLPKMVHEMRTTKLADATARRKEIEAELEKIKDEEKAIAKEIQHMNEVAKMMEWTERNNSMKWYKEEAKNEYLRDAAWKYFLKLQTAVLDVYITVAERTDMKKFKYEVSVTGTKTSFSGDPYSFNGGTHRDHDAIKKVNHTWKEIPNSRSWGYVLNEGAPESSKKFSKLADAELFAKHWMELIETYYKAELKKDRDLLKLAKKAK